MADENFRQQLLELLPRLRAYALMITRSREQGDDLMQDAIVRALNSAHTFMPGTNFKAWMFTILRNQHISNFRRNRVPTVALNVEGSELAVRPAQEHAVSLTDFHKFFHRLPIKQQEAILMVGANGFTYEEAGEIAKCTVGTMKSRVSRARAALLPYFEDEQGGDAAKPVMGASATRTDTGTDDNRDNPDGNTAPAE